MGRGFHEHSDDVKFESYHPGCMGGIFNVLDYHHWYKMFPQRKYIKGRHAISCGTNPQTISMEREPGETRVLLDSKEGHIQVKQQTRKTDLTNKSSGKASTKGLTGNDKPKEENHKHWNLGFSARPQSQQSDTNLTTRKQPQVTSKRRGARTLVNQKLKKEVSDNQVKEGADVFEMFKLNKDLFLDILQDPEVGISQHLPGNQTSRTVKFTKSVSFPMPNSSRIRYLKSSTLEHKQQEVWSFKKGEKSKAGGAQLSKSRALRTDLEESSSSSSQGSDSQRWNHLVMNRLKYIKQRIKQALRERRKSSSSSHKMVPEISLEKTTMDEVAANKFNSSVETDASDHVDTRNGRLNRIRRTKSINESLDRYTQLFEHSVNKKADLHHSKSLKLTDEFKISSRTHAPKFFRRISSLSDIESIYSLVHEVSRDALSSEMLNRTSILNIDANKESDAHNELESISFPEDVDKFELAEGVLKTELQENLIEGNNRGSKPCDVDEQIVELPTEKTSPHQEQESASEGLNRPNLPKAEADQSFLIFESDKKGDPCYNYVRDILQLSGFIQNEQHLQTWYSADQPLNPSLYKELETLLHPDDRLDSSIEETRSNCDHHQLVFDLVNETLLEISENSPIYFHKSFRSINCCTTQMLKVKNIVEEVWTKVSRTLNSQPEFGQSLDDIVARDMAKDGWMNLQAEAEVVALELEILVFDEVLDELLCL